MSTPTSGLLIDDRGWPSQLRGGVGRLVVPAVLLRAGLDRFADIVHVYVPESPTVAFSVRDTRSPGISKATRVAQRAGFVCAVRSPGGRMVAYDSGAVVVDHITRREGHTSASGPADFEQNAARYVSVLRSLADVDLRVGEVDGEYCPGEFSVNVAGSAKVLGSAQRVAAGAALFSTVVQVAMSPRVRAVLIDVSRALGYPLRPESITGLGEHVVGPTPASVAEALQEHYRARLRLADGTLPAAFLAHLAGAPAAQLGGPFRVDDWARANPAPVGA